MIDSLGFNGHDYSIRRAPFNICSHDKLLEIKTIQDLENVIAELTK